jgi:hypothetical protein
MYDRTLRVNMAPDIEKSPDTAEDVDVVKAPVLVKFRDAEGNSLSFLMSAITLARNREEHRNGMMFL